MIGIGRTLKQAVTRAVVGARWFSGNANVLLRSNTLPPFSEFAVEHVEPAMKSLVDDVASDLASLESSISSDGYSPSWSYVEELQRCTQKLSDSMGMVSHLQAVQNSDALREAHEKSIPLFMQTIIQTNQSLPLLQLYEDLASKCWDALDRPQQRIVESNIRSMKLGGVALEGDEQARYNEIVVELAQLSAQFGNNVIDATKSWGKEIVNKEDLAGMPASALSIAAAAAGAEDPEAGPWKLSLEDTLVVEVLKHAANRSLREETYKAYVARASDTNEDVFSKILELKQEQAELLGFRNYADLSLESKMAENVQAVVGLLEKMRKVAYPSAKRELEALEIFAKNVQKDDGFSLKLWDVSYWSERQREELFSYSEEELRPYFSLDSVLQGMFSLTKSMFGVEIVETNSFREEKVQLWHKDCRFYSVVAPDTKEVLASFYLDPFSRPAEKSGGAWMGICRQRSKLAGTLPVAYLVCNGSPPVGDKPSLMTLREVTTLFHEFGHGLQHMLTRVGYEGASGIANVEWDAVEIPSQFMENWCYHKQTVDKFARHYETGETIPVETFEKICSARKHNGGINILRQLFYSRLDIALHTSEYDIAGGAEGAYRLSKTISEQNYSVFAKIEEDKSLCAFIHIFAGGYAAGYYSYLWAEVMAADAFASFEEGGLDNEDEIQRIGQKFRSTILEMGGGEHPAEVYKTFRGRAPSIDALLRHRGLSDD